MITDNDFLLSVLSDGEWHSLDEILDRSHRERGCRLTVHSRASNLRHLGYTVENHTRRTENGRTASFYRLLNAVSDRPRMAAPATVLAQAPETALSTSGFLTGGRDCPDGPGVLTLFDEALA